jgi:hypothetical protein
LVPPILFEFEESKLTPSPLFGILPVPLISKPIKLAVNVFVFAETKLTPCDLALPIIFAFNMFPVEPLIKIPIFC